MRIHNALLLALFAAAPVTGQAALYEYIPQPPQYGDPSPQWLRGVTQPSIGGPLIVDVPATTPGGTTTYFLLTGFTRPDFDIGILSSGGSVFAGILYSSGEAIEVTPPQGQFTQPGRTLVTFQIPGATSLLGAQLYQQVAEMALPGPLQPNFSFRLGRGGKITIGI